MKGKQFGQVDEFVTFEIWEAWRGRRPIDRPKVSAATDRQSDPPTQRSFDFI